MADKRSLLRRLSRDIPKIDAILSLADQLGIMNAASVIAAAMVSFIMIAALWIWSNLPWWASTLVTLTVFSLSAFAVERILLAVAHAKAAIAPEEIDRIALANECGQIARGILSLVAEHTPLLNTARHHDSEKFISAQPNRLDIMGARQFYIEAEGRLIEKFGERYYTPAWEKIHAARKVINLNRNDTWPVHHGIHGIYDITALAQILLKISADLRYGQPEKDANQLSE